jgi:nucleotide-binding universal stress UspA family protein
VHAHPFFKDDLAVAQMSAIGEAEADLEHLAGVLRAEGVETEVRIPHGEAAPTILDEALFGGVDAIVMSTHGRGGVGRWIYGSVADRVIHNAEVPVLVVPPGSPNRWPRTPDPTIVVPLDGSSLAEEALGPASALAESLRGRLLLLRVVEPVYYGYGIGEGYGAAMLDLDGEAGLEASRAYLEELASRLRAEGRDVRTRVEVGVAAATIARVAEEEAAVAIAMATHGRGGLARLVLGSVATALLQRAREPILLVRPALPAAAQADQPPTSVTTASRA